jgi:hypothetical protein
MSADLNDVQDRSVTGQRRPLRLWVLSDLHLDRFEGWSAGRIPPADVAVVAGGITRGLVAAVGWLGQHLRPHMPVVFVPGPLEYFDTVLPDESERGRRAAAFADVRLLDGDLTVLDGVRFIGSTLWTDYRLYGEENREWAFQAARLGLSELRWIRLSPERHRQLRPEDAAELHMHARASLEDMARRHHDGPTIVVTHHAPHRLSLPPDARVTPTRHLSGLLPASYASDLGDLVERMGACLWVHGAVPQPIDYRLGRTRILANPRGKGAERATGRFDPAFVVEV